MSDGRKAKFDQEAAFKSIMGAGREPEVESQEMPVVKAKNKERVQRSYPSSTSPSTSQPEQAKAPGDFWPDSCTAKQCR